mmetsp:Transcript_63528/g.174413  ORF Transcript_63528/g.174413 Transcript_63528/m.174413 type:complete len:285 (-) Transcript_63528:25-879(-)
MAFSASSPVPSALLSDACRSSFTPALWSPFSAAACAISTSEPRSPAAASFACTHGRCFATAATSCGTSRRPGSTSLAESPRHSERRSRSARASFAAAAQSRWKPAEGMSGCCSCNGRAPESANSASLACTAPVCSGTQQVPSPPTCGLRAWGGSEMPSACRTVFALSERAARGSQAARMRSSPSGASSATSSSHTDASSGTDCAADTARSRAATSSAGSSRPQLFRRLLSSRLASSTIEALRSEMDRVRPSADTAPCATVSKASGGGVKSAVCGTRPGEQASSF